MVARAKEAGVTAAETVGAAADKTTEAATLASEKAKEAVASLSTAKDASKDKDKKNKS